MSSVLLHKIDNQRRLCIQKDLKELNLWMYTLEEFNNELDSCHILEKQLIHNASVSNLIKALRRKNVLSMALFCKYNQELKDEWEYGKTDYDVARAKVHEKKREQYMLLIEEYSAFKKHIYKLLMRYQRK
ncbi:hypothetical protein FPF71_15335 [Algibacter amylolyticus]|uniref:Uncharacterized protein n=1 Tax=Algibacter amylolyticus TaxID=1608400 RepID=A0A5M7B0U5_9FLAO|nr:hypothetical protein [Algibacter amylolyticus]KAA5821878.1 hypothetical protein F2B50_15335 [Algibacter amylolyticus]MBB5269324.1 hypothetical protein [Algibacter amylolyticus]TSJ73162.1 hypothetical protein FPF71_15335 [Algibacter amylolyticus]